jgi:spore coat polysaccharide biosynthesis protein SpsF
MTAGTGAPSLGAIGVVVQVRLGSTRLARKALLPLGGATMTDQVLARLSLVPGAVHVLATDEASAADLEPIAARHSFDLVVGPAEDVLGRYCMVVRRFGLDRVIRATGDNPLVNHELARALIEWSAGEAAAGLMVPDYAAYAGLPLGMGVEFVSARALLRAEAEAGAKDEREHVCPYLYRHPELFQITRPEPPAGWALPSGRVTVDTAEDYEAMLRLYGALYAGSPIASAAVMDFLRAAAAGPGAGDKARGSA